MVVERPVMRQDIPGNFRLQRTRFALQVDRNALPKDSNDVFVFLAGMAVVPNH